MRYGEGLLEEILRRTDLVKLVGRRVKLARKGRVFWGLCPFHKEKSPSFKVENERRNYHCFGCGAGGSAFKWLQETEGLTFPEAVQRLAAEAGVELPAWTPEDEARRITERIRDRIAELRWTIAGHTIGVTAGTGLAAAGNGSSLGTLLAESDAKLYDAKTRRGAEVMELGISV